MGWDWIFPFIQSNPNLNPLQSNLPDWIRIKSSPQSNPSARHNRVRDALLALAKNAGFSAESVTRYLLDHTPELLGRRPADVYIRAWDGAQDMLASTWRW